MLRGTGHAPNRWAFAHSYNARLPVRGALIGRNAPSLRGNATIAQGKRKRANEPAHVRSQATILRGRMAMEPWHEDRPSRCSFSGRC